jgi:hypothetical protein
MRGGRELTEEERFSGVIREKSSPSTPQGAAASPRDVKCVSSQALDGLPRPPLRLVQHRPQHADALCALSSCSAGAGEERRVEALRG